MLRGKEPTWTHLVAEALRGCDDFLDYHMLRQITGASSTQVSAACFHLRKRHAIDCIIEPDGVAWWYALPPEDDNRMRRVEDRCPECKPRKRRTKAQLKAEAIQAALRG